MIAPKLRWPLLVALANPACGGGGDDSGDTTQTPTSGATVGDSSGGTAATDDGPSSATDGTPTDDGPMSTTGSMTTNDTTADVDTSDGTTTGVGGDPGQWLLSVDNSASPPNLVRIDLADGGAETVCSLPAITAYTSIALARDGTLYGLNAAASRLDTLNPCNCGFQIVGPTSTAPLVLTVDAGDGMYGIDTTLDAFVTVDLDTGLANPIGGLTLDFAGAGASYADQLTSVYAVDDTTDSLYSIDEATGVATALIALSEDVTNPGLAIHPDGTFYVCDGTTLYTLDHLTGILTVADNLGVPCTNLTAPRTGIACLDG